MHKTCHPKVNKEVEEFRDYPFNLTNRFSYLDKLFLLYRTLAEGEDSEVSQKRVDFPLLVYGAF